MAKRLLLLLLAAAGILAAGCDPSKAKYDADAAAAENAAKDAKRPTAPESGAR